MTPSAPRPAHHRASGGYVNPWPGGAPAGAGAVLRWQRERRTQTPAPDPPPGGLPLVAPQIAAPRAAPGEVRATWIGHASFLLQIGGYNLLTDPVWSRRASPLRWAGPARLVPPAVALEALPPLDAVVLSHDHYDHLDRATVRALRRSYGDALAWYTPLGYRRWFARQGVHNVHELDWWDSATLAGGAAGALRISALPAQHWTSRTPWDRQRRLWASWALAAPDGRRLYFGGDSGYFPGYAEIGRRTGPFDVALLPIGAYAPRWFMRPMHLDPAEAVRAWHELGEHGILGAMHWGTFRLSDEPPLEPPRLLREAWAAAALPPGGLWVPRHGETLTLAPPAGEPAAPAPSNLPADPG